MDVEEDAAVAVVTGVVVEVGDSTENQLIMKMHLVTENSLAVKFQVKKGMLENIMKGEVAMVVPVVHFVVHAEVVLAMGNWVMENGPAGLLNVAVAQDEGTFTDIYSKVILCSV